MPGSGYGLSHSNGNYRLQTISPCVNTGSNLTWMVSTTDIDGYERIQNKVVDMGAYETYIAPAGTVFMIR